MRGLRFDLNRLRPVSRVQCIQLALDTLVDLFHPLLKLVGREVLVAIVHRHGPVGGAMPITAAAAQVCAVEFADQSAACHDEDFSSVGRAMERMVKA
jgi:hypothetical protein